MLPYKFLLALAGWAASLPASACSPPAYLDQSGFIRHQVSRLPANALGVMFFLEAGAPKAADFRVESADDQRPLRLRVRAIKGNGSLVRVELADHFKAGARYQFRYVRTHRNWRFPDHVAVDIDYAVARTAGNYAIELARHPAYRLVTVPTSSGSCVEPVAAAVREFTYAVPPELASYRDFLWYGVDSFAILGPAPRKPSRDSWRENVEVQHTAQSDHDPDPDRAPVYNAQRNAVRAECGTGTTRLRLRGVVSFPEVDDRRYRTEAVAFALRANVEEGCVPLEALLQTMQSRDPDMVLRQECGMLIGGPDYVLGQATLTDLPLDRWEFALGFFFGLSPTCDLVTLARRWQIEPAGPSEAGVSRLAMALKQGLEHASPELRDQALHALAYLVAQLPAPRRGRIAPRLLAPVLPVLMEALSATPVAHPAELARLMMAVGALPRDVRQRVQVIADGHTPAAPFARAVLAGAMP